MDYRGARYYDGDVARFLSLDPLAAKYPALSAYNYVGGNPIIFVDSDGKYFKLPDNFVRPTVSAFQAWYTAVSGDASITFMAGGTGNLEFAGTPQEKEKMKLKAEKIIARFGPGGTQYKTATDEEKKTALFLIDFLSPNEADIPYTANTNNEKDYEDLKPKEKAGVDSKVKEKQVNAIEKEYTNKVVPPPPAAPAGGGAAKKAAPAPLEKKDKKSTKPQSNTGAPSNPDEIYKSEGVKK